MPDSQTKILERTPLYEAIYRDRYSRQNLIKEIENKNNRRLIIYYTNTFSDFGSINRNDIPSFGDLLMDIEKTDNLDLLIHSSGGDIDSAEKIVYMCRYKANGFRVIVPQYAKSAATLIALASDSIVMGYTSELGPIDPQVSIVLPDGKRMARPAMSFLEGLENIKKEVKKDESSIKVYLPLLRQLDPALLDFCKKAIDRSKKFAFKWLSQYMCRGNEDKANSISEQLSNVNEYLMHGTVIDYNEAANEIGLNVEFLEPNNELWKLYWGLYCQYEVDIRKLGVNKIFESSKVSLTLT